MRLVNQAKQVVGRWVRLAKAYTQMVICIFIITVKATKRYVRILRCPTTFMYRMRVSIVGKVEAMTGKINIESKVL